mmetsp:Transcript_4968/g.11274  ORF Transcript_4968/g.11274 Transcript_4968/m.11274 type:complete len:208 (-) Transcript_4968:1064-1687(-)
MIGFRLHVDLVLLRPHLVEVQLRLGDLCELPLKLLDLAFQVDGLGLHLVYLGGEPLQASGQLVRLPLRFSHLLVAVRLVGCLAACLFLQFLEHLRNQSLHLREGVLAGAVTILDRGRNSYRQLREGRRLLLLGEAAHEVHHFEVGQVSPCGKVRAGCSTGVAAVAAAPVHLEERGRPVDSSARPCRGLCKRLLCLCKRLQLFLPGLD